MKVNMADRLPSLASDVDPNVESIGRMIFLHQATDAGEEGKERCLLKLRQGEEVRNMGSGNNQGVPGVAGIGIEEGNS